MPPLAPPRTDDGPMCRVCGCTRHNACPVDPEDPYKPAFPSAGWGCEWVETSGRDAPRWLCSACSGTAADLMEVLDRGREVLELGVQGSYRSCSEVVHSFALAAKARYQARLKLEEGKS